MAQMLLLWLCLALLLLGVVLASCLVVIGGLANSAWAWLAPGILVVAAIVFDETWFSLYPVLPAAAGQRVRRPPRHERPGHDRQAAGGADPARHLG